MEITDHQSNIQIIKDFSSNLISAFSADMFSLAMGLMLLAETGMSLSFGLSMIIMPLVSLLGLMPIGNLVDRHPHKPLLVISILIRLIALVGYALTIGYFHGVGKIIPTVLFLIINYIVQSVMTTGYNAAIHELVNEKHIQKLSSLTQSATSFANIFSPIVATSFYALLGFKTFIAFSIAANALTLVILLSMKFHYQPVAQIHSDNAASQWAQFKDGLHYIGSNQFLRCVMSGGAFLNLMISALNIGMPFMVVHQLHAGDLSLGILNSLYASGVLIGNLVIAVLPPIKRLTRILTSAFMLVGVTLLMFGFVVIPGLSVNALRVVGGIILCISGISLAFLNTPMGIYIQKTVPTDLLGRVSSTVMSINMASTPIGIIIFTVIFQVWPSWLNFTASGAILIGFTMVLSRLMYREERRQPMSANQPIEENH
ncbi:MFS transporter [Lentilactobacillus sp. TOM.63]|uniref:MFS transporter n=1 Tax=Lentilactobacillus TaxID=2767893 RepID=UPI001C281016|nr:MULTISPECIES: MFS transporter [Lentilactobacillus]MBU9788227.1 MFS transporter [Lentilactobacillus dabitei]MDM7517292.1 MFS transporter [Lentilactobacillus sp. TOM.63]